MSNGGGAAGRASALTFRFEETLRVRRPARTGQRGRGLLATVHAYSVVSKITFECLSGAIIEDGSKVGRTLRSPRRRSAISITWDSSRAIRSYRAAEVRPGKDRVDPEALGRERANSQVCAGTSSRTSDIFLSWLFPRIHSYWSHDWSVNVGIGASGWARPGLVGCRRLVVSINPRRYLPAMTCSSSSSRASSARSGRVSRGSRSARPTTAVAPTYSWDGTLRQISLH